jgi:outer membrane protein OmpA-like peptidoglycan-associated protein
MWDQYLEALRGQPGGCPDPEDAKALLDEALAACAGRVFASDFVVYFGFNRTNLTDTARATLDEVVEAVQALGTTALSVVGHTDTVGSDEFNQGLSERRARRVADALVERGVPAGAMTLAGRGERELAKPTPDNTREPLNRRVEITLSN